MKPRQIVQRIAWAAGLAGVIYAGYGVVTLFLWNLQFSTGLAVYHRCESAGRDSQKCLMEAFPLLQSDLAQNPHDSYSMTILGAILSREMLHHLREGRQEEALLSAKRAADYLLRAMHLSPAEAGNRLSMGYLLAALSRHHPRARAFKEQYLQDALALAPKNTQILEELIALYRREADWDRSTALLREFSAVVVERNPPNLDFLRTDTSEPKMLQLTDEFFMYALESDPVIHEEPLTIQGHTKPVQGFPAMVSAVAISNSDPGRGSKSGFSKIEETSEDINALLAAVDEADVSAGRLFQEESGPVLPWFSRLAEQRNPFIVDESLSEHERDAVLRGIEDAIGREPAQAPLLHIYAACAARRWGRKKVALQHVQTAVQMLSRSPLLREALGDLYLEMGMVGRAMESYCTALKLPGHSMNLYLRVARLQLDHGDPEEAEITLRKAIGKHVGHYAPYVWLGDYYLRCARRYDLAMVMFRKASRLAPDHPLPYAGIGYILEAMGHEVEAVTYFLKAASHQHLSERYRAEAARLYQKQGKYRKALEVLELALARHGSDQDALLRMGELHLVLEDYPSAAGYFERCLECNPLSYWARLGAALAYERMDHLIMAISLLEGAIALYPGQALSHHLLSKIHDRMGDTHKARRLKTVIP